MSVALARWYYSYALPADPSSNASALARHRETASMATASMIDMALNRASNL